MEITLAQKKAKLSKIAIDSLRVFLNNLERDKGWEDYLAARLGLMLNMLCQSRTVLSFMCLRGQLLLSLPKDVFAPGFEHIAFALLQAMDEENMFGDNPEGKRRSWEYFLELRRVMREDLKDSALMRDIEGDLEAWPLYEKGGKEAESLFQEIMELVESLVITNSAEDRSSVLSSFTSAYERSWSSFIRHLITYGEIYLERDKQIAQAFHAGALKVAVKVLRNPTKWARTELQDLQHKIDTHFAA
jgi:hypothetical protein